MPKSKRAKVVHLSKTQKKGKELTLRLYANIQECVSKYPYIYVFRVDNMRNTYLKDVRTELSDSRLFFGKTKVMAVALGLTPSTEPLPSTSLLTPLLTGPSGLLFSPQPPSQLLPYLKSYTPTDYARAGILASRSFTIPSGIVYATAGEIPASEDIPLAHSMEANLRKLGVPTKLVKGKVVLECGEEGYVVCREGERLGSRETGLLKMFGVKMSVFRVEIVGWWEAEGREVVRLEEGVKRRVRVDEGMGLEAEDRDLMSEDDGNDGADETAIDS